MEDTSSSSCSKKKCDEEIDTNRGSKRRRGLESSEDATIKAQQSKSGFSIPTLSANTTTSSTARNCRFIDKDQFLDTYQSFQVVYLPQLLKDIASSSISSSSSSSSSSSRQTNRFTYKDVPELFSSLGDDDKKSWTLENYVKNNIDESDESGNKMNDSLPTSKESSSTSTTTTKILLPDDKNTKTNSSDGHMEALSFLNCSNTASNHPKSDIKNRKGYCSFLVQHSKAVMDGLLERIPISQLPIINSHENLKQAKEKMDSEEKSITNEIDDTNTLMDMTYGPCIWFFFGRNEGDHNSQMIDLNNHNKASSTTLRGRPEHTDSVSHDGTWHYQLSGSKIWNIRPTEELLHQMEKDGIIDYIDDDVRCKSFSIHCKEGDVFFLNTRLWWHSTEIPIQSTHHDKESSFRERYVPSVSYARDVYFTNKEKDHQIQNDNDGKPESMSNLDGLYAANDIESGTIIFRESDMPDCELHRSNNPNCEVTEIEDGEGAIVSTRDIKAGEFFCIEESSDEEGEEEGEDYDEEEDIVCRPCD